MNNKHHKLSMTTEPNYLQKRKKAKRKLSLAEELRKPITVSKKELEKVGGHIDENKCFHIDPKDNNNIGLIQAQYWVHHDNDFKARQTLKGLGLRNRIIKVFIDEEKRLLRKYPDQFIETLPVMENLQ